MERSKAQWIKLLQGAGFCNLIFYERFDHDGIIEAGVRQEVVALADRAILLLLRDCVKLS
jgi:hypothetical protein